MAYSSLHIEPTWMTVGHSAGVAAAISAEKQIPVQNLDYAELRKHLLEQKQILDLPVLPALK